MIKYKKIDFGKVNKVFPDIAKVFTKYGSKIVAAYVFGSFKRGEIRLLSDIDLAVLEMKARLKRGILYTYFKPVDENERLVAK